MTWQRARVPSLRRGSHRRIAVTCEFRASPRCRGQWAIEERLANETRAKNDGKIICQRCSIALKRSGRTNPNARYRTLDDGFLATIDTEAKAYLLGWIASDGAITKSTIAIYVHNKDAPTLRALRDLICAELPLKKKAPHLLGFTINSARLVTDVCRWLDIPPGKKSSTVGFPQLAHDALTWAFIRGLFEGDGSITSVSAATKRSRWPAPRCNLTSNSKRLLDGVAAFCNVPAYRGPTRLEWGGANALDFLGKIYPHARGPRMNRKYDLYMDWCCWSPVMAGGGTRGETPLFRWARTLPEAVPPGKSSVSDSGFDLTLVARSNTLGSIEFFRTGIRIQPAFGWYFDLVPRSSITKTGYMLANGVGVIDRAYTGEIFVPLIKVDPNAPPIKLPCRLVQIIPRPIIAAQIVEVASFDETARGAGGFGSTG